MVSVGKEYSTQYVKKRIHKRCSGDLSRVADGFRCSRCNGTIQEADLTENLMVDGETYECVKFLLSGRHS